MAGFSPSSSPAWEKRRRELFERALEVPRAQRVAFVQRECGTDTALRDSVLRLIAAGSTDRAGALDNPVYHRPPATPRATPERIGDYRVLSLVGAGGMGDVYVCEDPHGKTVALKLVRTDLNSSHFLERFDSELRIHAELSHPNVCRLLGAGKAQHGTPYIVMEFVQGTPLDEHCLRNRCDLRARLLLFTSVLAGVEYFHRRQVVHRDLKPSNILVTSGGIPKILDFGIAKFVQRERGATGTGRTSSAIPLMSLPYASPEQLLGRKSGQASDIYALGTILYQILCTRHPFCAGPVSDTATLVEAMKRGVPATPATLVHGMPPAIDRLILRALDFEPSQRPHSAGQMLEEIRLCLASIHGA